MPTNLLKQLVPSRPHDLSLVGSFEAQHGAPLPEGEFRRFLVLSGELDLSPLSHRAMELVIPTVESLAQRLERGVYVERMQALLCASSIIARRGETFYTASWATNTDGGARVYLIRDDEWGMQLAHTSIASFVFERLDTDPELFQERKISEKVVTSYRKARLRYEKAAQKRTVRPAAFDPEQLFGRVEWLIDFFLYAFKGYDLNGWEERLAQAAPYGAYLKERELLADWPHLGIYWLWSHFLFGNSEALDEARTLLVDHGNVAVRESLALIGDTSRRVGGQGHRQRIETFCREIAVKAPERVLAPKK